MWVASRYKIDGKSCFNTLCLEVFWVWVAGDIFCESGREEKSSVHALGFLSPRVCIRGWWAIEFWGYFGVFVMANDATNKQLETCVGCTSLWLDYISVTVLQNPRHLTALASFEACHRLRRCLPPGRDFARYFASWRVDLRNSRLAGFSPGGALHFPL